ncbi:hypothetical protein Brsp07_03017 [Brucella sp. NBRC 14130]|uniref:hypothetical protein n=1 Tax=Brucella sp. NBRC 14130 TaxID=3075483 RepID=UPI00309DFA58
MNVSKLAENLAELLSFPVPTAQMIARSGREQGVLSSGGRGRNAARATSKDAAYLLIAMMVAKTPARATEYMNDFGDLLKRSVYPEPFEGQYKEEIQPLFVAGSSFVDGIASLLDALGSEEFFDKIAPKFRVQKASKEGWGLPDHCPEMAIEIFETKYHAGISFDKSYMLYLFEGKYITDRAGPFHDEGISRWKDVSKKYHRLIHSSISVGPEVILALAGWLNGIRFDERLICQTKSILSKRGDS